MKSFAAIVSALALTICLASADEQHHHTLSGEELGSVHFATTCNKDVESSFNRGVALLHSFQYEKARTTFLEVSGQDPNCAMAAWGVAMTHYHGLWENGDIDAGRVAIDKAQHISIGNPRISERERAYIAALAEIYRTDDQDRYTHAKAFEQKMGVLQSAYPNDMEAAIFHALALDITAPKTDKTFTNQEKCGEILEPLFVKQPHHPGIAHYLIHCYDNPMLAEKGLNAARAYAKVAPASAHANHMPSHIFTRVGSWDESIASNKRSAELATADEQYSKNGEARDQRLHAMDYLEYAELQSGRVAQAEAVFNEVSSLPQLSGLTLTGNYAMAAIPARRAMELRDWKKASAIHPLEDGVPWARAISWMAIGIGSARSGDVDRANQAEQKLVSLRDESKNLDPYWTKQIEVQRQEVSAWIAEQKHKSDEALAGMRSAANLEESMDKAAVTPGPVTPAREMLAELLAIENRPAEALNEYEAVLKTAPNRFNAVYGAARAAEAGGNATLANEYYQTLTNFAVGDERPELVAARKKIVMTSEKQ